MNRAFLVLFLSIVFYSLIFSVLSLGRHWSLNSTYLDLGLESQILWNSARGRFFETSFGPNGELVSALSYHTTPIILLLTPLYRLLPFPETLLILQTVFLAGGALAVFLLAKMILSSETLALVFSLIYLLYPPLQYTNLSDFHFVALATPLLLFAFYFMIAQRWRLFYLCLFLAVLTKENVALVSALLGAYLFVFLGDRKRGAVIFLLSVFYFWFAVYFLMPALGGGFGALGRYQTLMTDPLKAISQLVLEPKIKYLFHLFVSVGFLPLLAPAALLPAVSELFLNLFSDYNPQWQVKFHYTAAITPFIFISAIYGARHLRYFLKTRKVKNSSLLITLLLLFSSLSWSFIHSPSPLFYKFDWSKYQETNETQEVRKLLKTIPTDASVSAMNNLGPHLANRRFLYRFPINYLSADYVVVDPSVVGKNFDLSQITKEDYESLIWILEGNPSYQGIRAGDKLIIYKKIKKTPLK